MFDIKPVWHNLLKNHTTLLTEMCIRDRYLSETEVAVQDAIKALETGNKNLLKRSLQTVSDQLESLSPDIYVDVYKRQQ